MKKDLTTLLCAVPLVPFTVKTIEARTPGHWIYRDEAGILVSERKLV